MRFKMTFFLLLCASPVLAQDPVVPELRVIVAQDTARGWYKGDTLNVQTNLGDTINVRFFSQDWPIVHGYWISLWDGGLFGRPDRPTLPQYFKPVGYTPGPFLSGPDLPTSQSGIVYKDGSEFQMGLVSLGERQDSGNGHLGDLSFELMIAFEDTLEFRIDRFYAYAPSDSLLATIGQSAHIIVRLANIPPSPEPVTSDFNRNGIVDFQDFVTFARYFDTMQGRDDRYDPQYDLVLDGHVNFSDFVLFASDFGREPRIIRQ